MKETGQTQEHSALLHRRNRRHGVGVATDRECAWRVTFFVNSVYYKYRQRFFRHHQWGSTLNRAIQVPLRIKCLLAITGVLVLLMLIATLVHAYFAVVS